MYALFVFVAKWFSKTKNPADDGPEVEIINRERWFLAEELIGVRAKNLYVR